MLELNIQQMNQAFGVFEVSLDKLNSDYTIDVKTFIPLIFEFKLLLENCNQKSAQIRTLQKSLQYALEKNDMLESKLKAAELQMDSLKLSGAFQTLENHSPQPSFDFLSAFTEELNYSDNSFITILKKIINNLKEEKEKIKQQFEDVRKSVLQPLNFKTSNDISKENIKLIIDNISFNAELKAKAKFLIEKNDTDGLVNLFQSYANEPVKNPEQKMDLNSDYLLLKEHIGILEKEIESTRQQLFKCNIDLERSELSRHVKPIFFRQYLHN